MTSCPADAKYAEEDGSCVAMCESQRYKELTSGEQKLLCMAKCDTYFVVEDTQWKCVDVCPTQYPYLEKNGSCVSKCNSGNFTTESG